MSLKYIIPLLIGKIDLNGCNQVNHFFYTIAGVGIGDRISLVGYLR